MLILRPHNPPSLAINSSPSKRQGSCRGLEAQELRLWAPEEKGS